MERFEAALALALQPAEYHSQLQLEQQLLQLPEAATTEPKQQQQEQTPPQQQPKIWSEWARQEIDQQVNMLLLLLLLSLLSLLLSLQPLRLLVELQCHFMSLLLPSPMASATVEALAEG